MKGKDRVLKYYCGKYERSPVYFNLKKKLEKKKQV